MKHVITDQECRLLHAYWRAANYLSVGQIYLLDILIAGTAISGACQTTIKLGHWGTTPGLNFIYAHLNRVIKKFDLNMLFIAGPWAMEARHGRQYPSGGHL
ncbi:MAG: hypothetical protein R3B83_02720 [Nitrospirales bacterium]